MNKEKTFNEKKQKRDSKELNMKIRIEELTKSYHRIKNEKIRDLERLKKEIIHEFNKRLDSLYSKEKHKTKKSKKELKKLKISFWKNIVKSNKWILLKYIISMPFIYGMIIPGLIFHFCLEIYHQVAFKLYNIPRVKAKDFFIFDRYKLPQLNWLESFNCFYCTYYNSLIAYAQEIIGRTERFWCPIKHAYRLEIEHKHYKKFIDYYSDKKFKKEWEELRKFKEFRKN